MNADSSEELWIQNALSGAKLSEIPRAYVEKFERDVYARLGVQESRPLFPSINFIALTVLTFAILWMIRGSYMISSHPYSPRIQPQIQRIVSQASEASIAREPSLPVIEMKPTAKTWEKVSDDLLVLEMLGEDSEFMEEAGTVDSDLQMISQSPALV